MFLNTLYNNINKIYLRIFDLKFDEKNSSILIPKVYSGFNDINTIPVIYIENKILMKETEEITKNNSNLNLVFAFNYGSHNEIHSAVMELHNNNLEKVLSLEEITSSFYSYFQYSDIPYPDLLLRTAGEKRISNFLLYQLAYQLSFDFWLTTIVNLH